MELLPTVEGALDFVGAKTKDHVHGLHPYPARMIPQIAQKLIEVSIKGDYDHQLIVDPFCGSGTVLTEALLANHQAIGIDINPLAVLLAKVRSKPLSLSQGFPRDVMSKIKEEKRQLSVSKDDENLIRDVTLLYKLDNHKKSDKTIYRYVNELTQSGLLIKAGQRVITGKTATETLYTRKAKIFLLRQQEHDTWQCSDCKTILSKLASCVFLLPRH